MKFQVTGGDYVREESGVDVVYIRGQVVDSSVDLAAEFPDSFTQVNDLAIPSTPYPLGSEPTKESRRDDAFRTTGGRDIPLPDPELEEV